MSAGPYFLSHNLYPKYWASAKAASLPDGSINAYKSFSMESKSPVFKLAVVPLISDATSDTNIFVLLRFRFHYFDNCITKKHVIIFVNDAISLF